MISQGAHSSPSGKFGVGKQVQNPACLTNPCFSPYVFNTFSRPRLDSSGTETDRNPDLGADNTTSCALESNAIVQTHGAESVNRPNEKRTRLLRRPKESNRARDPCNVMVAAKLPKTCQIDQFSLEVKHKIVPFNTVSKSRRRLCPGTREPSSHSYHRKCQLEFSASRNCLPVELT